jgi:hypothetical protein
MRSTPPVYLSSTEYAEFVDDLSLSLEDVDSVQAHDRAQQVKSVFSIERRLAICLVIAEALSRSALSRAEQSNRVRAWCAGLGVDVAKVERASPTIAIPPR